MRHSTIDAEGLNGRVRDGIGCDSLAIATRPFERMAKARMDGTKRSDRGKMLLVFVAAAPFRGDAVVLLFSVVRRFDFRAHAAVPIPVLRDKGAFRCGSDFRLSSCGKALNEQAIRAISTG